MSALYRDKDKHSRDRILTLPNESRLRHRIQQKLKEYSRRRQDYIRKNRIADYGVLIGQDTTLLDSHYKEALFSALLTRGMILVDDVYDDLKQEFHGYINDAIFANAVSVLKDYLYTGGANTSGGSGFISGKLFSQLLEDHRIVLPSDPRIVKKLRRKYHEYLGRIADFEQHPDMSINELILKRDSYKAQIIDVLQQEGAVDLRGMAQTICDEDPTGFDHRQFYRAAAVIRSYCHDGGRQIRDGTGF